MKIGRVVIAFLLLAARSAWGQAAGDALGQSLLDSHHWEQAAQEFDRVASKGGPQADSALYWRAYALNKLEFRGEALAALAELRKTYPTSRWLQDAAALEMEIRRGAGDNVTPESQSSNEMKLLALNGLMKSDPERAVPAIESLLKESQSPALKHDALYVLAQSASPAAQRLMEQVARGGINLDLQALAVRYLVQQRRDQVNLGKLLFEIYNSTPDTGVKREALNGLVAIDDGEHLSQIPKPAMAQTVNPMQLLRLMEVDRQLNGPRVSEIVTEYQSQKDRAAKLGIVDRQASLGNAHALVAIARVETDPHLKRKIVEHLIDLNTPEAKEYLLELLK